MCSKFRLGFTLHSPVWWISKIVPFLKLIMNSPLINFVQSVSKNVLMLLETPQNYWAQPSYLPKCFWITDGYYRYCETVVLKMCRFLVGIMCPHRGAVFSYRWRHVNYPFGDDERVACNVFFTWEMMRPLLKGASLYVIPDSVIYDPPLLLKFLKDNQITRVVLTPSLLGEVMSFLNLIRAHTINPQMGFPSNSEGLHCAKWLPCGFT